MAVPGLTFPVDLLFATSKGVGVNSIAKCQLPEARTEADGTGKEKTWKAKGKGGTRLDDWESGLWRDAWRGWMCTAARVVPRYSSTLTLWGQNPNSVINQNSEIRMEVIFG